MIVEVTSDERNIQVARLANGFAVIQRLQHRQQTRVLLNMPRNGIHIASAYMSRRLAPGLKGCTGGSDSSIHIGTIGGGNLCQWLAQWRD